MQKLLLRRRSAYASIFAVTLAVLLIQSFSPSSQTSSFSLSLDLDEAVGGQAMRSLNVSPDQGVSIQIFGTDIQNASGLSVRIEYDATQVVYEGFDTGDVLPNVRVQKGDSTAVSRTTGQASFVQINLASLGGSATVNSGLVGTLRFLTTDAFLGTEIRLVRAALGRGEQSEAVPLSLSVALRVAAASSPDFDGSGTVDFPDFLFLVSVFGSRLNDGKYETKYDLDGNGEIAFDDFLIFVSSFGKSVDTIDQPYATKRVATSSDFLSVCDRTPQVRDAIVTALGATDCGSVTEQNLSNLTNQLAIYGSSESSISALKVGDFSGLSELRRLRLINNSLTTLDNNAFVGMSKLKTLEVSGGNISDIHAGAFGGLDSLSALSLEDNNITSLRDNTFEPLTELRILRLNSNDITSVSSLPLDDLSGVLVLDLYLASNKIASLSSRDFADVSSNLIFLDLQGNKLSALPDSLFYNMVNLLKLDFRSNSVDPLNVRVSLEKIQNSDGTSDKFFAKVHTGAPFDLNVPVTVSGGTLDVDNNVVTISAGSMSSSVVTATRIDATADNDITVTLGDVQISMGDIQNTSDRRRGLAFEKVSSSITLSPEVVAVFVFEPSVTWGNEQVSFVSADAFGVEENSSNVGTVSARIYRRPSEFKDLGDITGLTSGKGYFENNESLGDGNHEKYYRFVLTQSKVLNIGLRQLDVDTDLILEDADGSELHLGTSNDPSDPSKKRIIVSLCEGTYYAHVKIKDFGENIFNFRYGIVPSSPDASEVSRLRGRSIGGAVSGYTVSGGSDGDKFSISESGLLTFNDVPNYEDPLDVASTSPLNDAGNNEYVVVVTGSGESSSRTQSIVVTVSDKDDEAPGQPAAPTIAEATMNSLKVTWEVPANAGPEITDYDVQYKASGDDGFTGAEYDGTDLTMTLTNLKPGTSYEVQVRATSDEGTGAWSDSGSGTTDANAAPVFTSSATFEVKENNTTVGAVSANDGDSDDSITGYAITGGADQEQFEITDEGGLRFKAAPNYEVPADVESADPANVGNNNEYIVEVTATGGASERVLTAAQTIVVTVTDKDDEAPGQPAAPTIAEATLNSLKVTWAVPANAGPEITDYDVQYKASGESEFTDAEYDGTDLTMTLTNLKPGTSYEVQVRATSDEGTGAWSDSGSGMTIENQAPIFTSSATFEVKENNTTVGAVSANDEDSDDSITGYAITGGVDQEQFEITDEGGLRFKAAPNYEVPADVESADPANAANNNEYIVEVTATGGKNERVLTAKQTIVVTVTDKDDEAPGQPAAPTIAEATLNSLKVTWAVPANAGPEITDYDVQYKASGESEFTDAEYDGTDLTMTLTNLKPGTSYEVQVRATSDEGTGVWSDSGSGMTIENQAPVFTSSATFEVKENNTTVGAVSANDEDSDDSITGYAITGGVDQEQFEITEEGGLSFKAAPNYEVPADVESADPANVANNNEYIVEVTATGGASDRVLTAAQTLTVTVTDKDDEAPGQVETPVVSEATMNSLKVTWEVPANTGPEITDYDVQYKASDDDGFTDAEYDGTDLTMTLTNLKPGTSYEVQVRAENDEGTGAWSDSGSGTTDANAAPVFTSSATFEVKENNTTVGAVSANDEDSDDSITGYAITGGVDQEQFEITDEGGLRFKAAPNYEVPADVESADPANVANNNEYIVEVTATGGASDRVLTAKQTLTVTVTDKDDEAPGQPAAPTIAEATLNSLKVTWTAPANMGPEITDYDVQYKASGDDGFTDAEYDGTDLTLTLTNLKPGTSYEVQVRATNDEGTGVWSDSGEGMTIENQAPVFTSSATFEVKENNTTVGAVSANDEDSDDSITGYAITGGVDQEQFEITDEGGLRFKAAPNYEVPADVESADPANAANNNEYIVEVTATGGASERVLTAAQMITVTVTDKDDEAPGQPAAPTIAEATMNSLKVTWAVPANAGPEITDYDVQYKASDDDGFTDAEYDGTDLTMTLTNLKLGTSYEVQVRAENDEGTGNWSDSGEGMTIENQAPVFSEGESTTRSFAENTAAEQDIGNAVVAKDEEGSVLSYSLEGDDADSFEIVSTSGQLQTKDDVTYNYEEKNSYVVRVKVVDSQGGSKTIAVTISLIDVNEAPVFTSAATFEVKENNTTVGTASANDEDSDDSITGYAITGGADQEQFEITDEGGLSFKAAPNYEVPADVESADPANAANNNEYIVEVTATGGASDRVLTAKQTLTVTVSDKDNEAPGQVETPVVSEATMNSLKVTWEVPANTGPEITDYDVQYKASDDDGFNDAEYDGTDLTMTLTNLKPGTSYEVQVRAKNDEGTGAWSELLSVKTVDVFSYTNRLVNENSVHVGLLGYNRNMRYSIVDGQDGHLFSISRAGMLKFKSAPDYERPSDADGDNVYVIDIQAQGGELSSHQQQILVEVTDVDIPLTPPNVEISHSVMPSVKVTGIAESSYPITEATSFVPYTSNGNGYFYWIDSAGSNIQRYSIGSGGSDVVISGLQNPTSLALDPTSEKIYWADSAARKIQRANLDGSKVEDIATFNPHARAYEAKLVLDLDNGKVYWTSIEDISLDDSGNLQAVLSRANFDGSSPELLTITETTRLDFAFFDGRTYMSYGSNVIDIATPNGSIILSLVFRQVNDLSVSNGKIYWANNSRRVIRRANVDGSNAEDIVAVSGDIDEVVFDPTTNRLYWTIRNAGGINFLDVGGDMDVQYRVSNGGDFVESNKSSGMTEVISGLTPGETYDVQARLSNKESQSEWSETIQVLIIQPVFACNENSVPVGFLGYSYGGNMQYSIVGGQDGHLFSISEAGMLRFKAAPDYEMPLDADTNNAYIVKVTATSGENGRALTVIQTITVIVTDIGPPAELDAPTVTETTRTSLTITWENTSVVLNTDNVSMFNPMDVALDIAGNKMYWTDSGSIRRADLDGTNVENVIRDAVQFPVGIALDIAGNKMYWVDLYTDKVQRADLNGENIEDLVTTGQGKLGGIALDIARNKMYWMDSGSIRRADLDGENIEDLITGLPDKFGGIALDIVGNKMYWAIGDRIRRADLDGTNVEDLVTTGLENLFGIALDIVRNKMYWADRGTDKVQRADLNGRNVEDLIATGLDDPFGIALDIARNKLYWTETGIQSKKIGRIDLDLNYDIQYRIIDTTGFISANYTGEDLTTTLTDLTGTCEVQVRATNAEGTGDWSPSIQVFFTHPPEFPFESVRWNVRSHSTTSPDLDTDVSAQDNGNAPLTYTLIGPDADDFIFDPSNGRVQPKSGVYFDRDVKGHYDFSVVATGVRGGSDTLDVAIHVLQISNKRPYYDTALQPLPIVLRLYNQRFSTNSDLSTVFKDDNEDDSDSFRYSLSGKDHRMFQVDQETGQLSPNPTYHFYFSGSNSNVGAFYTFKLHVSDGHGGTAEVPVHVYVSRNKTTESFRTFVNWRAWNGGSRHVSFLLLRQ